MSESAKAPQGPENAKPIAGSPELPETISCPWCRVQLDLTEEERTARECVCPQCQKAIREIDFAQLRPLPVQAAQRNPGQSPLRKELQEGCLGYIVDLLAIGLLLWSLGMDPAGLFDNLIPMAVLGLYCGVRGAMRMDSKGQGFIIGLLLGISIPPVITILFWTLAFMYLIIFKPRLW